MKKYSFILLAAASLLAACAKESPVDDRTVGPDTPASGKVEMYFTATSEDTKTTLDPSNNYSILWGMDDDITVFAGADAAGNTFHVASVSENNKKAVFEGLSELSDTYYAVFPASNTARISAGVISATLATEQTAVAGTFAPKANLSVGSTSTPDIYFKNVGTLVGVTLGNDGITGIKLEGLSDSDILSGAVTVNADGTLVSKGEGVNYVSLTGNASAFVNGSTYYFVVLPGTYASGLRVTLYKGLEFAQISNTQSVTFERNGNFDFGTLTATNWLKPFELGDPLTIQGGGADEAGQRASYVGRSDYWNTTIKGNDVAEYAYNYEIFTTLKAGSPFYFAGATTYKSGVPNVLFGLNAAGTAVEALSAPSAAAYSVESDGVYRIRMALPGGIAEVKKINEVKYDLYGADSRVLSYQGAGVWKSDNFLMRRGSEGYQNRYRFLVKFTDDTKQYYGRMSATTDSPTYGTTGADYFYMQPSTDADHWDPCFKYQNKYEITESRYYCTMTVAFNNDNNDASGHYTHSISNIWDKLSPIATGEYVTVQGSGIASPDVAGTKMRYSTTFYNSEVTNSGDRVTGSSTMADPAGYDYEIFVKLSKNTKFYFTAASGHHFAINAAGNAIEGIFNESEIGYAGVGNDGVYRVRINSSNGAVALKRAESVRYLQPDRGTNQELSYLGNGVWRGFPAFGWTHPQAWGNSERFKFKFQIYFNETNTWQYYGRYETESVYTSKHIQPITDTSTLSSWNNFLTVEGDPDLAKEEYQVDYGYCDLYLKLNADGYTYEINNIRK